MMTKEDARIFITWERGLVIATWPLFDVEEDADAIREFVCWAKARYETSHIMPEPEEEFQEYLRLYDAGYFD